MRSLIDIFFPVQHVLVLSDLVFVDQGVLLYTLGRTGDDSARIFLFELPLQKPFTEALPTICYNIL